MLKTLSQEMWNQRLEISGTGKTKRRKKTQPMYDVSLILTFYVPEVTSYKFVASIF